MKGGDIKSPAESNKICITSKGGINLLPLHHQYYPIYLMRRSIKKIQKIASLYAIASLFVYANDAISAVKSLMGLIDINLELTPIGELFRAIKTPGTPDSEKAQAAYHLDTLIGEIKNKYSDSPNLSEISNALDTIYSDAVVGIDFSQSIDFADIAEETSHEHHNIPLGKDLFMNSGDEGKGKSKGYSVTESDEDSKSRSADWKEDRRKSVIYRKDYLKNKNEWFKKQRENEDFRKRTSLIEIKSKLKNNIISALMDKGLSREKAEAQMYELLGAVKDTSPDVIGDLNEDINKNEVIIKALRIILNKLNLKLNKNIENKREIKRSILKVLMSNGLSKEEAELKFNNEINQQIEIYNIESNDHQKIISILKKYLDDLKDASKLIAKQNPTNKVELSRTRNKVKDIYFKKLKEENPNTPAEQLEEKVRSMPLSEVDELYQQLLEEARQKLSA